MEYNGPTEEVTLPSGKVAVVKEITGKAETVLADANLIKQGRMVTKLLHQLLVSLDGEAPKEKDVDELYTADRRSILLKARQLTYGDLLDINYTCTNPRCQEEFNLSFDINDEEAIKWTPKPETLEVEIVLPASGKKAILSPITGVAETKLAKSKPEERLIDAVLVYLKEIEGVSPAAWRRFLENASARDTKKLRETAQNIEFGPETNVEVECPFCNTKQNVELTNEYEFFFPRD